MQRATFGLAKHHSQFAQASVQKAFDFVVKRDDFIEVWLPAQYRKRLGIYVAHWRCQPIPIAFSFASAMRFSR